MAKNMKTPDTPAAVKSAAEKVFPFEAATEEPKFGKVEVRLAALESYVKHNVKTLGWPEFKG